MTIDELRNFDLNLLLTFFVLCEEQSVTLAAKRMGLSQSATSHALSRLRNFFDDPLFVRTDGRMEPTAFTQSLQSDLNALVGNAAQFATRRSRFEASTSVRKFSLASPDVAGVVLAPIAKWFSDEAPEAQFRLRDLSPDASHQLTTHGLDLLISPRGSIEAGSIVAKGLGTVERVSFVRDSHPFSETVTPEEWSAARHIVTVMGDGSGSYIADRLEQLGANVSVEVPNFLVALAVVADTDAVFSGPRFMADYARRRFGLREVEIPFALPSVELAMFWHSRWNADEGHLWFRTGVSDVISSQLSKAGK